MQPLSGSATATFGLMLLVLGHATGWPIAVGGSQAIADAMASLLRSLGGTIETGCNVRSLDDVRGARSVLFDVTPRQLLAIAGEALSTREQAALGRYRYGPGAYKLDLALSGPLPWTAPECRVAGTVHLGGSFDEIAAAEQDVAQGRPAERPFVLVSQPTVADPSRAPAGGHVVWAYAHVPNGSDADVSGAIEAQIERFAPGFRSLVRARNVLGPAALEAYNPNYVGGDINGGAANLRQLLVRPTLRRSPYTTSDPRLYLCSSSTPPGGGVHGMCGWHAAQAVLRAT
jgi:phytoene dehydrogenase-like protein